jgi:hypothetical protein
MRPSQAAQEQGGADFSGRNMGAKAACLGFCRWRETTIIQTICPQLVISDCGRGRGYEKERMDFFGELGWRDAVLLVVVLAVIYLVVSLLALARLRRQQAPALAATPSLVDSAGAPGVPPMAAEPALVVDAAMPPELADEPAVAFEAELSARLAKTELEAEVKQLRRELAALREELAEIKATRRVSPLYAEAAALAQRGFDARGVAAECGISVAEAELVLAMSRDSKDFDKEVDDGADGR